MHIFKGQNMSDTFMFNPIARRVPIPIPWPATKYQNKGDQLIWYSNMYSKDLSFAFVFDHIFRPNNIRIGWIFF